MYVSKMGRAAKWHVLMVLLFFSSAQSGQKTIFYHAPHVGFHVLLKEITWDYVEPEEKPHGKRTWEQACVVYYSGGAFESFD